MPIVTVQILEGYDSAAKTRLGRALTEAVRSVIPAPPEAVTVILNDMPAGNYFRGGENRSGAPALPDGRDLVLRYLQAMEARDLDLAQSFLAPDVVMTFPGPYRMTSIAEMVERARGRYRFVTKTYDHFDAMGTVVYCFGTLAGEWPDGTPFSSIRFIDRFEFAGGLIVRQDVWNDLAEAQRV